MNRPPVPLPAEHIPSGAADWQTPDARRWLAAVPARWAHPLWAVLALLVSMVWYIAESPLAPCTSAEPCGTDWSGLGMMVVLVLTPYWVWRQPRLALAGLAAGLVGFAEDGGFTESFGEPYALAYPAAAAFTIAGIVHRLALAGRQRALALEAAGPVAQPLPAAALTFRRGRFSFALAALMLAVAGFGYWQAQQVADAYEERAANATHLSGRVAAHEQDDDGDDVLKVEADERTHRIGTAAPEDFPVDSRVDIVVDGDWAALVAEPYDAFDWELLAMAGSAAALAFFANGVDGRTRARRLRRGPLPVLRVLVREGHEDGSTWVFAADDPEALRPILHFHSLASFEEDEEEEREVDESDLDEASVVDLTKVREILQGEEPPPPLREAVLYGVPYTGAEVAFVAGDEHDDTEVLVECSVTAVKPAVPGLMERGVKRRSQTRERRNPQRPVEEIAASMAPTAAPRVWKAHSFSRAVGLGLLLVQGGGIWAMLDDGPSWTWLWLLVGAPVAGVRRGDRAHLADHRRPRRAVGDRGMAGAAGPVGRDHLRTPRRRRHPRPHGQGLLRRAVTHRLAVAGTPHGPRAVRGAHRRRTAGAAPEPGAAACRGGADGTAGHAGRAAAGRRVGALGRGGAAPAVTTGAGAAGAAAPAAPVTAGGGYFRWAGISAAPSWDSRR